jgi:microcompartment protein CcmL/EutN
MAPVTPRHIALAAFELSTISTGVIVADQVAKTAAVDILFAEPVSPGKFVVVFGGPVGEVTASYRRGESVAGSNLLDRLLLPQCHPTCSRARGPRPGRGGEALGVIETDAVPATLLAADRAAKTAPIRLRVIRSANGLGGKGFIYLDGTVSDVNAAVSAARAAAGPASSTRP